MPGRRYPRRTQSEAQSSHVRSVFRGGLDGASTTPYPVGWKQPQSGAKGNCAQVFFFNEEFSVSAGSSSVMLSRLPLPYSEHVYLVRSGQGLYKSEGIAWTRDAGKRDITLLSGLGAQSGDLLVVEYACYETVSDDPCGPSAVHPLVVVPGAAEYPKIPQYAYFLPAATGFPNIIADDRYSYGSPYSTWVGWHASSVYTSGSQEIISSAPGLLPTSTYSRRVTTNTNVVTDFRNEVWTFSGQNMPQWSKATKLGTHVWFRAEGISQPPLGTTGRPTWLQAYSNWTRWDAADYFFNYHILEFKSTTRSWYIILETIRPGAETNVRLEVPIPNLGDPYAPGVHFIGIEVDCASKTMTVKFDDNSYSYTHPKVWPDPEHFAQERNQWYDLDTWSADRKHTLVFCGATALDTDSFTITDDVPFCPWVSPPLDPGWCENAPVYSDIHMVDTTVFGEDSNGFNTPYAAGMPVVNLPGEDNPAHQGAAIWVSAEPITAGPPLAPGSKNSWSVFDSSGNGAWGEIDIYGGVDAPRWTHATYMSWSGWFMCDKLNGADSRAYIDFSIFGEWGVYNALDYRFVYDVGDGGWQAYIDTGNQNLDDYPYFDGPMTGFTVNPLRPVAMYFEIYVDFLSSTVTFELAGQKWSFTGPAVVPSGASWDNQRPWVGSAAHYYDYDIYCSWYAYTGAYMSDVTTLNDQLSFKSDIPWCRW